jgi:hypothetical protein
MSEADLGGSALWTLIPVSAAYGIVALLIFRRLTQESSIRRSLNRILAHLMELSLFLDSPGLVWRAQRDLLRENIRLLRLVILPGGIAALVFALLFSPMNTIYGHAPLPVGEPSVVTIQRNDAAMPLIQLEAPDGIVVETPGVRVLRDRQISWRVRPLRPISGELRFRIQNRTVRAQIRYPQATILSLPWLVWFVAVSSGSAMVFGLCWRR